MSNRRKIEITLLLILVTQILVGCGTNGLLIRYFYGEMDDKLYDRILAYASFTEAQKAQIKQSVDEYKQWHQQNELPRYITFLDEISNQISSANITTKTVLANFDKARGFAKTSFEHSPFYDSADFLKNLSNQQVDEIENHFSEQNEEFQKWYQEPLTSGDDARLKRIVQNTKRFAGINLNDEQQQIIRKGLAGIKGRPLQRHEIYNRWQAEFIETLQQRKESNFIAKIKGHLSIYQDQIRLADLEQYQHNQEIVVQLVTDIIVSLDNKQKQSLVDRLQQTRETLLSLSAG